MDQQVPSAIAGSMGKEKKPFTYLPGGLDFSEIRSPKMAKPGCKASTLAFHKQD